MIDHWELLDVFKALLSVAAGMVLGLEREMKDKVAGLKTITIICLGATLFAILSFKVGSPDNPTYIAAYVVTGVGFIGAGAIFKEGNTVSGLTTAGIIWLAAAIGLAIGFSEFYMAATFLGSAMLLIFSTPYINKIFSGKKMTRQVEIVISKDNVSRREQIIAELQKICQIAEVKKIVLERNEIKISVELVLTKQKLVDMEEYLLSHTYIIGFSLS